LADLADQHRPKMIIAGATAYSRGSTPSPSDGSPIQWGRCFFLTRRILPGSSLAGAPNPVPFSDIVTFTTHKTLRGLAVAASCPGRLSHNPSTKAVFPGLQGGPLEHVIAAKAVAFYEAAQPDFALYAAQIIAMLRPLAGALAVEGFRIVSGGTDNT